MKERIICAAVRNEDTGKIYYGHRHSNCFDASNSELSWTMNRQQMSIVRRTQGFITSENRFVDRKEALTIALECGQITDKKEIVGDNLFSENLY